MDRERLREQLAAAASLRAEGRVVSVVGLSLKVQLPAARVGDRIEIQRRGPALAAEIVGFDGSSAIAMPLGDLAGVGPDDAVISSGAPLSVAVGPNLLGRIVDGFGQPIDGKSFNESGLARVPIQRAAPPALQRRAVRDVLPTGVRVIDTLMSFGEGQRVGLFAGSGVGKSTLLGALARGVQADVVVVALVGERGREVSEFIDDSLGTALQRSVVVVATSDAPALERLKAAQTATAIAEHFRDAGKKVMLLVDSVTRFARAQREVGLAAGEPPTRRGYPPSVFAALPALLERSGQGPTGSITALYTVLVEGGDMDEPVADEVRGILDGHVVLDREIAARGWFPAVNVGQSLSRVMQRCVNEQHAQAARNIRRLLGAYEDKRDLVSLGAYKKGGDRDVDQALAALPELKKLLCQDATEQTDFEVAVSRLCDLAQRFS